MFSKVVASLTPGLADIEEATLQASNAINDIEGGKCVISALPGRAVKSLGGGEGGGVRTGVAPLIVVGKVSQLRQVSERWK